MAETETSRKSRTGLSAGVIKAGQIAGAITAVVTAGALLWNLVLKPAPPPASIEARLSKPTIHAGIPFRAYLNLEPGRLAKEEASFRASGVSESELREDLRQKGVEAEFTITTKVPAGHTLDLTRTLNNAVTLDPISEGGPSEIPREHYVPPAGNYSTTEDTFISTPPGGGTFYVEVEIKEPNGKTLDAVESAPFRAPPQ
jgi:hypothetical protein